MANPEEELSALREQLATLTSRVYRLEQTLGTQAKQTEAQVPVPTQPGQPVSGAQQTVPPATRDTILPKIPLARPPLPPRASSTFHRAGDNELEGKIGR